jgi:hypothetical protein
LVKAFFKGSSRLGSQKNPLYNFLTLKCGGGLDMLMMRIAGAILINHELPSRHLLTLKFFFLNSIEFIN